MDMKLTKTEYRALLDVLVIADWVFHAHKTEEDPKTKKFRSLEQKIFSFAEDAGYEKLVKYDKKLKKHVPTEELEQNTIAEKFIDEYDNDTFWEGLAERLAG